MSYGVGLGLDGLGSTPEGDYTLSVATDGDAGVANPAEITVDWGDGFQTTGIGAGDYAHSLFTSGSNYEGDAPPANYTITTTAVSRAQASIAGNSDVTDAAVDSLGRRVTVGGSFPSSVWQVRRYNADGSVDNTFSGDGLAELTTMGGLALAVGVDSSDRVVVAGRSSANQFTVARLNANGTIDATFGPGDVDGNGVVTTTFGTQSSAQAIAIQPNGQIVVAGNSGATGLGDFVVARYNVNGSLDTTFDVDGKALQTVGGVSTLHDVALGASGRVVTAGTKSVTGDSAGVVVAFTAAGAANGQFTVNALVGSEHCTAVTVVDDGSILLGESGPNGELVLAKLTAAGAPVTSFGSGGVAVHEYQPLGDFGSVPPATFDSQVRSLIVRDDLSIVAGGLLVNPTTREGEEFPDGDPQGNQAGLAIFKFDADGNKDLGFDGDGVLYTPAGSWIGGAASGGQVSLLNDTLIQSGTVQDSPSLGNASDGQGVYLETATFAVSVSNVAPTASFAPTDTVGNSDPENFVPPSNLTSTVPGEVSWFAFETTDPSWTDFGLLTYHINWGDGTSETFESTGTYDFPSGALFDFPFYLAHAFEASGNLTVTLTVSDEDGATSVATFGVNVATTSGIVDDYAHPGQTVLYVAAPLNQPHNKISIRSSTIATQVIVDGSSTFANVVDRVVVYGNVGDDQIQVDGGTSAALVEIYSGPGNDKLKGANRNDIFVGAAGDDMIVGGTGRDLLIGGPGADKLIGDAEDDILIGGIYTGSSVREAVGGVMAEWSSANTYADRVANLRAGTGASGGSILSGDESNATVFDDNAADKLTGDAGQDWFFANADGAVKDKITDLLSSEFSDEDRAFVAGP